MNSDILCQLLAERINPIKFQLRGLEIYWLVEPTPEEINTAADVVTDYSSLALAYLAEEQAKKDREAAYANARLQAIADNLPDWAQVEAQIDGCTTVAALRGVVKKMARIMYLEFKGSID